nr:hypothetical protein CFP56_43117 [Quercus suber]
MGTQIGLPVIPYLEPTSPIRMEVGESPSLGDPSPLNQETHASVMSKAYASVMSKALHKALDAQDITSADVDLTEESPAPPEKAGIVRQEASMTAMSSAGQTKMNRCLAKASVVHYGPFSNGFHAGDSPVTLDRANIALFHTTRTYLESIPLTEHMGCLAETSAEAA